MKESTGELSMVVITIVAVIAVLAIWNAVKEPVAKWVGTKFGQVQDGNATDGAVSNAVNQGLSGGKNNKK